jgi:hypothetical protein
MENIRYHIYLILGKMTFYFTYTPGERDLINPECTQLAAIL